MKRLTEMSHEQVIAYNLRDGGTAVTFFAEAQTYRVQPGNMEPGHVWCYDYADYLHWYELGGHRMVETHLFSGPFPEMVMGLGVRA